MQICKYAIRAMCAIMQSSKSAKVQKCKTAIMRNMRKQDSTIYSMHKEDRWMVLIVNRNSMSFR